MRQTLRLELSSPRGISQLHSSPASSVLAERKYPVHEKELLAVIHALRTWRCYLEGRKCRLITDHASLQFIQTQPSLTPRQARWWETLASYDLEILYRSGDTNVVADALSRRPDYRLNVVTTAIPDEIFFSRLKAAYARDSPAVESSMAAIDGILYTPLVKRQKDLYSSSCLRDSDSDLDAAS